MSSWKTQLLSPSGWKKQAFWVGPSNVEREVIYRGRRYWITVDAYSGSTRRVQVNGPNAGSAGYYVSLIEDRRRGVCAVEGFRRALKL